MLRQGQVTEVTVEDVAFGGEGVARMEGMAVFIPFAAPGERLRVKLTSVRKRFARAEIVEILQPHPRRVRPLCPVYGKCGGCQYQHLPYDLQLETKRHQIVQILRRIGGLENPTVEAVIPSPREYGYRNKITLHGAGGRLGYMDVEGRHLVPVSRCPIASVEVNDKLRHFLKRYDGRDGDYVVRSLEDTGDSYPWRAFHQVNSAMIPLLLQEVGKRLDAGSRVLVDAYCGSGLFMLEYHDRYEHVTGIEMEPRAVETAQRRIRALNRGGSVEVVEGAVETHLFDCLARHRGTPSTLLLDPPRTGCGKGVVDSILMLPPAVIVYVSCNPATLARDLKLLEKAYLPGPVTPLDMFPQTAHVECVVRLCRR